jgi:hypothetical protein
VPPQEVKKVPEVVIPENASEFYSNLVIVGMSEWDISLLFGSTSLPVGAFPLNSVKIEGGARIDAVVRMSPRQAKALLFSLGRSLNDYETKFGGLKMTESENADIQTDSKNQQ